MIDYHYSSYCHRLYIDFKRLSQQMEDVGCEMDGNEFELQRLNSYYQDLYAHNQKIEQWIVVQERNGLLVPSIRKQLQQIRSTPPKPYCESIRFEPPSLSIPFFIWTSNIYLNYQCYQYCIGVYRTSMLQYYYDQKKRKRSLHKLIECELARYHELQKRIFI